MPAEMVELLVGMGDGQADRELAEAGDTSGDNPRDGGEGSDGGTPPETGGGGARW